jgi:hypothetical protein
MSSFYQFDKDTLDDSKSFTLNIVKNIVPKNGKAIVGTSMSARGFTGRTLTSPDLISAASGKYLFKNPVYENVYRANLIKENYTGLLTTMLEGQLTSEGQEMEAFAAKVLVQSGMGRQGSDRGLLGGLSTALNSTYNNSETVTAYSVGENSVAHVFQDYSSSPGAVSPVKYVDVALVSRLTDQQKSFYLARGELLSKNIHLSKGDIGVLKNGFKFDIRDSNLMAEYDVTNSRFLPADQIERRINESLIRSVSETAYISANLIECLMALASYSFGPSLRIDGYWGGFGTFRQDGTDGAKPRSSGSQGNSITDHAFGRAFDIMGLYENVIDHVERRYLRNITKINSKQGYQHQLDTLLRKLNAMPPHLVPDYMAVSAKYVDQQYDTMEDFETSILAVKYPNLKYLKIKRDTSAAHDNHIHISFAATRGGIYAGPNGQLATFSKVPDSSSRSPGFQGAEERTQRGFSINEYTKDYTGNTTSVDPIIIFNALVNYGLFTPELAACFVGIAWRESKRMVYVVQRVYGALGLWQVSTVPKDGGKGTAYLSFPQPDNVIYWKLALPDRANENLSDSQITSLINERAPKDRTIRIDLFDRRCWNIANQIDLVRSKMGFKGSKQSVDGLTGRVMAWGDGYWDKGWITDVRFSDISEVYRKTTRKN